MESHAELNDELNDIVNKEGIRIMEDIFSRYGGVNVRSLDIVVNTCCMALVNMNKFAPSEKLRGLVDAILDKNWESAAKECAEDKAKEAE